ncbi:unnamed protein product [Rotaria sp. Silwood1]|nr:unnamed protein product [Rotaria sp. Silwood1]
MLKYLGKTSVYVPIAGTILTTVLEISSDFVYEKYYGTTQNKLSIFNTMGDHMKFSSAAREVDCEITNRYKKQLARSAKEPTDSPNGSKIIHSIREQLIEEQDSNLPAERVANFAVKYVIETIRDMDLKKLGFNVKPTKIDDPDKSGVTIMPKTRINDLPDILINIICSAKSNLPRRFFKFAKLDVNYRLPIQQKSSSETQAEN